MNKFKVGQWVLCIDDSDCQYITNGKKYKVRDASNFSIAVLGNTMELWHYNSYRFSRIKVLEWLLDETG
jgi:hypothetical protein